MSRGFHLTPEMMEASYEYLRLTPPFKAWRLPEGDELDFHVLKTDRIHGDCGMVNGRIYIRVSMALVGRTDTLAPTMAHEMIHVEQFRRRDPGTHNEFFRRAAKRCCGWHGFDLTTF